MNEPKQMCVIL